MKKKTKKIICIILALLMVIEIVACSIITGNNLGEKNTSSENENISTQQTSDEDDALDAKSDSSSNYNQTSKVVVKGNNKSNKSKDKKSKENTSTDSSSKTEKKETEKEIKKYTITFIDDENYDKKVFKKTVTLEYGTCISQDQIPNRPNPKNDDDRIFMGYYFDKETFEYPFVDYLAYDRDITVYARYGSSTKLQESMDFVFEDKVGSDFSITLLPIPSNENEPSVEDVKNNASFYVMNKSFTYIGSNKINVVENNNGTYTVSIKEMEAGQTYAFYLSGGYQIESADWTDPLNPENKKSITSLAGIRFTNFTVYREESDIVYREGIEWISYGNKGGLQESDIEFSKVREKNLGTDDNTTDGDKTKHVEGFKSSNELEVGQVVCIYKGLDPRQRKYAGNTTKYAAQEDVYFSIVTEIKDNGEDTIKPYRYEYSCRYVEDDELYKVILIPQVIPFKVGNMPTTGGTVYATEYDLLTWSSMGGNGDPEACIGDYVVFYEELSDDTTRDELFFGKVTKVEQNEITYIASSYDEVVAGLETAGKFYIEPELKDNAIMSDETASQLESEINAELQSEKSQFKKDVEELVLSSTEVEELSANLNADDDKKSIYVERLALGATLDTGSCRILENREGAKVSVSVGGVAILCVKCSDDSLFGQETYLHYVVSISFTMEVNIKLMANGKFKIGWAFIIPYIKECWFELGLDTQLAIDFTLDIRHYVHKYATGLPQEGEDDPTVVKTEAWKRFCDFLTSNQFCAKAAAYFKAESEYELYSGSTDPAEQAIAAAAKKTMDDMWNISIDNPLSLQAIYIYCKFGSPMSLEDVKKIEPDFTWIQSFKSQRAGFNETALNTTIVEILAKPEDELTKDNIKTFAEKYESITKNSNEWINLVKKTMDKEDKFKGLPIIPGVLDFTLAPTFFLELNVNVALNANFRLICGRRFSFKVDIRNWETSSNSANTLNQTLSFTFVTMGTIGLRGGINIDGGFKLLKVFTVGLGIKLGPYIELDGYMFFQLAKVKDKDTGQIIESQNVDKRKGAAYFEVGIYVGISPKIKVVFFGGKSWNWVNKQWRIFWIGEKENVYNFAYKQLTPEQLLNNNNLILVCGNTGYKMPESTRMMDYMDLKNGALKQYAANANHYEYKFYDFTKQLDKLPIYVDEASKKIKFRTDLVENTVMAAREDGSFYRSDRKKENYESFVVMKWKEPTFAFSNYIIKRAHHILFSYDQEVKKYNIKVTIVDKDDSSRTETVWAEQLYDGLSYEIPKRDEILKLIDADDAKYVMSQCNYKDADRQGVPPKATGNLRSDMEFVFYVKRQQYQLDLHYLKEDNTETTRTYYALYGDSFNISDDFLAGSRVKVSDKSFLKYTNLSGVHEKDGTKEAWLRDWNQTIDTEYAKELKKKEYYVQANYDDNTLIVTYKFSGVKVDDVTTYIESGTIPPELKDIWTNSKTEAEVMKKLREAAGLSDKDPASALTYSIVPARERVIHNTTYLVNVKVDKLLAPYVVDSDKGNVKLDSENKVAEGEHLCYGVAKSKNATPYQIQWFDEPFIPNLKKNTDYYFFCRKTYKTSKNILYSPASDVWNWNEEPSSENNWRNAVCIESDDENEGAVNIKVRIQFYDGETTELSKAYKVEPGATVYTDDFADRHDPWMISRIYIESSDNWSGQVNTFSYNIKYGKSNTRNRVISSSAGVDLPVDDELNDTVVVSGPKRRIKDIGNFSASSTEATALPNTIVLSENNTNFITEIEGKQYWEYKFNGSIKDQFSVLLDSDGKTYKYEPYNVFEHNDAPYISAVLVSDIEGSETSPLNFIKCKSSTLSIDLENMLLYLGEDGKIKIKVKIVFPKRSTYIGKDTDGTQLTNEFIREIEIVTKLPNEKSLTNKESLETNTEKNAVSEGEQSEQNKQGEEQ